MQKISALNIARYLTIFLPIAMLWGVAAVDGAMIGISALFLYHSWHQKNFSWTKNKWIRIAFLFWVYISLRSLVDAVDLFSSFKRAFLWVRYPIFAAAIGYWILPHQKTQKRFIQTTITIISIIAIDCIIQYFTGHSLTGHPMWQEFRLTGPFKSPIAGMVMAWLGLPFMMAALIKEHTNKKRLIFYIAGSLITIGTIILTGDRAALLLTILAVILTALLYTPARKTFLYLATGSTILLASIIFTNPDMYNRQIKQNIDLLMNFDQTPYGKIWHRSFLISKEFPLFGVGTKNYRYECVNEQKYGAFEKPYYGQQCSTHPHNPYIEVLVEQGFIGLFLYLWLCYEIIKSIWQKKNLLQKNSLIMGMGVVTLVKFWPLISLPSLFISWNMMTFWLYLGWFKALTKKED